MATNISENETTLDQHLEHLQSIPTGKDPAVDIVARLMAEGPIGMRCAANIFGSFRDGKPTHSSTVTRWAMRGVKLADGRVLKLESFRLNGRLATSKQALLRFVQAQQTPPANHQPVQATPAQRNRAAEKASAELDAVLAGK
jgi:hypothetical protein